MTQHFGRRAALLGMAGGTLLGPSPAVAAPAATPAWRRAVNLGPGVNLSRWRSPLDQAAGDGDGPVDLARIAALGFRHVRLPVDPAPAMPPLPRSGQGGAAVESHYRRLADGLAADVTAILRSGLRVIVDMHAGDEFRQRLGASAAERDRFAELWETVARRLARHDAERVIFEPLNEPGKEIGEGWLDLQDKLIGAIRSAAPTHTILAVGGLWSTIGDLEALPRSADANLLYAFHFYGPMIFTHQGAEWSSPPYNRVRGVPYPLPAREIERLMANARQDDRAKIGEELRAGKGWDAAAIDAEIAGVARWARERGVPVACTEFGAYRDGGARTADRIRYIADVRAALTRHLQAWTMWDYSGGFGLVRSGNPPDGAILRALALAP